MSEQPHPDALRNFERACIPERKIRDYALQDPNKSRPFRAMGFSREHWEELREAITENLPLYPARFRGMNPYGSQHEVHVLVEGPNGELAPVLTGWIYRIGEDFPRLTTLYVEVEEWQRQQRERQ